MFLYSCIVIVQKPDQLKSRKKSSWEYGTPQISQKQTSSFYLQTIYSPANTRHKHKKMSVSTSDTEY